MPLRLKGATPKPGEPDRRYYMMDDQVALRRLRFSTGTRDRALAERREQAVIDAVQKNPDIPNADLLVLARGARIGARLATRDLSKLTIEEAFNKALADTDVWGESSRIEEHRGDMRVILRYLPASTPVVHIDAARLLELRNALKEGRRGSTVNRKMTAMSVVLGACRRYIPNYVVPEFPPRMEEDGQREFVLTLDEEVAIIQAVHDYDALPDPVEGRRRKRDGDDYAQLFHLLADTGLRLGEGLRIEWRDISWPDRYVRVWNSRRRRTKTGSSRTVPLTAAAFDILRGRMNFKGGPFLSLNKRRAQEHWARAREAVGINNPECVIHGLRHTFATRFLEATGDIRLLSQILGHSNINTTEIYAKVLARHARNGIDALEAWRAGRASGDAGYPTFRDRDSSETGTQGGVTAAALN